MTLSFSLDTVDAATRQQIIAEAGKHLALALATQQHQSQVYTVLELSKRLKCCEDTARGLLEQQKISYLTLGKKGYRITEAAVQQYLQQ